MIKLFCPLFWIKSISPLGDWVSQRLRDRYHVNEKKMFFGQRKETRKKSMDKEKMQIML